MSKSKAKQKRVQRRREQRRGRRGRARPANKHRRAFFDLPAADWEPREEAMLLDPPGLERCGPPICIDATGCRVPDPYAVLGLEASRGESLSEEEIRAAYRQRLLDHPPEQNPEVARRLVAARDRMLDPERVIEREIGVLHPPDPEAWGLLAPAKSDVRASRRLDALGRLMGQLVLYTLVEDEVLRPADDRASEVTRHAAGATRSSDQARSGRRSPSVPPSRSSPGQRDPRPAEPIDATSGTSARGRRWPRQGNLWNDKDS